MKKKRNSIFDNQIKSCYNQKNAVTKQKALSCVVSESRWPVKIDTAGNCELPSEQASLTRAAGHVKTGRRERIGSKDVRSAPLQAEGLIDPYRVGLNFSQFGWYRAVYPRPNIVDEGFLLYLPSLALR